MKKEILLFVWGVIMIGCGQNGNHTPDDKGISDYSEKGVDEEQTLESEVNKIKGGLPLLIDLDFYGLQLKSIEIRPDDNKLSLYVFVDKEISDNQNRKDEKTYFGKYIVAWLSYFPMFVDEIKSDKEKYQKFQEEINTASAEIVSAYQNSQRYKEIRHLFEMILEKDFCMDIYVHGKNGETVAIELTSQEAKDAVIFSREIIDDFFAPRMKKSI